MLKLNCTAADWQNSRWFETRGNSSPTPDCHMKFCRAFDLGCAVTLLVRSEAPAQSVNCRTNYYKVTGRISTRSAAPLPRRDRSAKSSTRLPAWQGELEIFAIASESGCRCVGFSITTQIVITMPCGSHRRTATPETKTRWTEYLKQLAAHEAGHTRIALSANAEVRKQLSRITSDTDCASLRTRINDAANRVLAEHRSREAEFDRRTRHGAEPDKP